MGLISQGEPLFPETSPKHPETKANHSILIPCPKVNSFVSVEISGTLRKQLSGDAQACLRHHLRFL